MKPRRVEFAVNLRPGDDWPRRIDVTISDGWIGATIALDEQTAGELFDRLGTALRACILEAAVPVE